MPDPSTIRHARERQFAEVFFDHDEWEAQPGPYRLSCGTKYTPDFLDKRRGVLIEVVGSRQAYHFNAAKYVLFRQEYPNETLEFRLPDGGLVPFRGSRPTFRKPYKCRPVGSQMVTAEDKHLGMVSMSILAGNIEEFLVASRWNVCRMEQETGVKKSAIAKVFRGDGKACCSPDDFYRVHDFILRWRLGEICPEPANTSSSTIVRRLCLEHGIHLAHPNAGDNHPMRKRKAMMGAMSYREYALTSAP